MNGLDHALGKMGWGYDDTIPVSEKLNYEFKVRDKHAEDYPRAYTARAAREPLPEMLAVFEKFQESKGYNAKSRCLFLLPEFIGKKLVYLPQGIGSCVVSNTLRPWSWRSIAEVIFWGDPEEYLGQDEFGTKSHTFFGPSSYGFARKRANMRGGDGLYCEAIIESMLKDGVVACNTPRLAEILHATGANNETDLPEVQSESLYRAFGDWKYNGDLLPFADFRLLESSVVDSADKAKEAAEQFKPGIQCSGIAIRKIGKHKDGFDICSQDPNNSWAHNMGLGGTAIASDGKEYQIISNLSWCRPGEDPMKYLYHVPMEEYQRWHQKKLTTSMTIGEIDLPNSSPAA